MKLEVKQVMNRELEVQRNVRRKFVRGLKDCEAIILPIARALAPERSGRYKRSFGYAVDEKNLEGVLYSGGKAAPHAHLVEWGTHKMAPHGTMRKTADKARSPMGQAIARRCREPV